MCYPACDSSRHETCAPNPSKTARNKYICVCRPGYTRDTESTSTRCIGKEPIHCSSCSEQGLLNCFKYALANLFRSRFHCRFNVAASQTYLLPVHLVRASSKGSVQSQMPRLLHALKVSVSDFKMMLSALIVNRLLRSVQGRRGKSFDRDYYFTAGTNVQRCARLPERIAARREGQRGPEGHELQQRIFCKNSNYESKRSSISEHCISTRSEGKMTERKRKSLTLGLISHRSFSRWLCLNEPPMRICRCPHCRPSWQGALTSSTLPSNNFNRHSCSWDHLRSMLSRILMSALLQTSTIAVLMQNVSTYRVSSEPRVLALEFASSFPEVPLALRQFT